jgi:hypothetical protein
MREFDRWWNDYLKQTNGNLGPRLVVAQAAWAAALAEKAGKSSACGLAAEQPAGEPVAVRFDYDGYGWRYIDSGSGSDWLTRHADGEVLYAAPPSQPVALDLLRDCRDYLSCIPESAAGGDDDAVILTRRLDAMLSAAPKPEVPLTDRS